MTKNLRGNPALKSSYRLLARVLSMIVRLCLWLADRVAYAVMALEAKSEQ